MTEDLRRLIFVRSADVYRTAVFGTHEADDDHCDRRPRRASNVGDVVTKTDYIFIPWPV